MAIGRTFEEAMQKSMRMVDGGIKGFEENEVYFKPPATEEELIQKLIQPHDTRVFTIAYAMQNLGWSVEKIHKLTNIDTWFLNKLDRICKLDKQLKETGGQG